MICLISKNGKLSRYLLTMMETPPKEKQHKYSMDQWKKMVCSDIKSHWHPDVWAEVTAGWEDGKLVEVGWCSESHSAWKPWVWHMLPIYVLLQTFMAAGDGPLSAGEFYHHQIIVFKILQIFHILLEMGASKASWIQTWPVNFQLLQGSPAHVWIEFNIYAIYCNPRQYIHLIF